MVLRGTIGRFARWGFTHGPAWGTLAAVIGGLPAAALVDANIDGMRIVLIGALAGLLAGPVLGAVVGVVCVAADRVPKWILDAPDYVAVVAVGRMRPMAPRAWRPRAPSTWSCCPGRWRRCPRPCWRS